jgi:hypothetical protein
MEANPQNTRSLAFFVYYPLFVSDWLSEIEFNKVEHVLSLRAKIIGPSFNLRLRPLPRQRRNYKGAAG